MRTLLLFLILTLGCTEQYRAKHLGGTATTMIPAGWKLVTATWKDSNLWVLTRPMHENEIPETYTFQESGSWGLLEGTVIIQESK